MLPILPTVSTPVAPQPTLVATPVPQSIAALRVPADNVPPSVSNVAVGDNQKFSAPTQQANDESSGGEAATTTAAKAVRSELGAGTSLNQTGFITQLIGQGAAVGQPEIINGILSQYAKIVAYSYVKYKPSNATLPPPPPVGVIGRILQSQPAEQVVEDAPASEQDQGDANVIQASVASQNREASNSFLSDNEITSFAGTLNAAVAASAYKATNLRNSEQLVANTPPPPAQDAVDAP